MRSLLLVVVWTNIISRKCSNYGQIRFETVIIHSMFESGLHVPVKSYDHI